MPNIYQLSTQLANMIAAGEVVERPASVAKELVENAIDAGSRHVTVEIKSGGVAYLRVTDDGCGILPEDVPMAFLPHATSKLRSESDLLRIGTLGFRGEALASVASVAKVDLFTRTSDRESGVQYTIEAGEETGRHDTGCPVGTTIVVRELFYNVPARAKFLKKDSTEGAYVETAVMQEAIAHPEVAFTLIKEGRESFSTPGNDRMLSALYGVYGKELAASLQGVAGEFGEIQLDGYISRPEVNRSSRNYQSFYINGRYVKSRLLSAAVEQAFKGKVTVGRYPVCFLNLRLNPAAVDVNVHPAKLEVKFAREREVFSAVYHAVCTTLEAGCELEAMRKAALPREDTVTREQQSLELSPASALPSQPQAAPERPAYVKPVFTFPESHTSSFGAVAESTAMVYKTSPTALHTAPERPRLEIRHTPVFEDLPALPETEMPRTETEAPPQDPVGAVPASSGESLPEVRVLGEAFHTYILAEEEQGLWLIDKHAAHEKILYDQICVQGESQPGQLLLSALAVNLTSEEKEACLEHLPLLERSGFRIEDGGIGGLLVREIPVYLEEADVPFVLSEAAKQLREERAPENQVLDSLRKSMACKAAIKAGQLTSQEELTQFARQVLATPSVRNCPHGRPAVIYLSRYELEKMFKRVQP